MLATLDPRRPRFIRVVLLFNAFVNGPSGSKVVWYPGITYPWLFRASSTRWEAAFFSFALFSFELLVEGPISRTLAWIIGWAQVTTMIVAMQNERVIRMQIVFRSLDVYAPPYLAETYKNPPLSLGIYIGDLHASDC